MTYKLSQKSLERLNGVHPALVFLVKSAMETQIMDFSVNEGVRTLDRQKELVSKGVSKTMKSKHLIQSDGYGHAVDLYPYPIDMEAVRKGSAVEISRFGVLAGIMKSLAWTHGIEIEWGGDFDSDGETLDHTFFDAPHFQLKGK
jgi:peptidoglycan L-alanyl-D-glutamate endopeptidase CwlK